MKKPYITSYYDFLLYEKKGVPEFLEKIMSGLNDINFKEDNEIVLLENDISEKSIIKISYLHLKSKDLQTKSVASTFKFDDFNFEINKFTLVNYNFTTFEDTKKEDFINYLSHEIHHAYQLYNVFKSTRSLEMNKSWKLNLKQQNFRGRNKFFDDFLYLLYKSLGLEIDSDIVGLYFKIKELKLIEKDDVINSIKNDNLYNIIKLMGDFKPHVFSKYIKDNSNLEELKKLIEEFNESYIEIDNFFEKWNIFFKRQFKKYIEKINRLVDLIRNEIK